MDTEAFDDLAKVLVMIAEEHGIRGLRVNVADIQADEAIRLKCVIPLCEYYNVCRVCPPHLPPVETFRKALEAYNGCLLLVLAQPFEDINSCRYDFSGELRVHNVLNELEKKAFESGNYRAIGLGVGGCKLCEECVPPDRPCRHPFRARPSPEGMGIDITTLALNAGVHIEWPPKRIVTYLGLLLF